MRGMTVACRSAAYSVVAAQEVRQPGPADAGRQVLEEAVQVDGALGGAVAAQRVASAGRSRNAACATGTWSRRRANRTDGGRLQALPLGVARGMQPVALPEVG